MVSRFIVIAICLVLIGALFPLPDIAAAAPASTKLEPFNVANLSAVSPYDGTYSGTFNYEYREKKYNKDYPTNSDRKYLYGEWVPASFKLTVTFKTPNTSNEQSAQLLGFWVLNITNVIVDDPAFGTGPGGVTPVVIGSTPGVGGSAAYLPLEVTNPTGSLTGLTGILISFPNGALLRTTGAGLPDNDLKVGFAEWTIEGSTWYSQTNQREGPLSREALSVSAGGTPDLRYEVSFKSWNLKKVPSSLTTATPTTTTGQPVEGVVLTGISGNVQIKKAGTGEWVKYDQTALKSGDEIMTGDSSKAVIELDGDKITMGANSTLTIHSNSNFTIEERGTDFTIYDLILLVGKVHAWINKFQKKCEVRTPNAVVAVRGTEFTVDVDVDGTTTVMVLEGAVSVQDLTSNNGITLMWGQSVTIPRTPAGLTQQDMLGRIKAALPETINRWWEKDAAATGGQAAIQNTSARKDGSFAVGKFEIMGSGSRYTPAGFIFTFLVVAAIFFLAVGQVFAFRLRRMSKRK